MKKNKEVQNAKFVTDTENSFKREIHNLYFNKF